MHKNKSVDDATSDSKESLENLLSKGETICQQGKYEEARALFRRALADYPDNARVHNDLAITLRHLGLIDVSLEHHRKAADLMPAEIIYQKNLADFLFAVKGQTHEAMEIYNRILASDPDDIDALLGVGSICRTVKKDDDARYFFKKVISLEPNNKLAQEQLELLSQGK